MIEITIQDGLNAQAPSIGGDVDMRRNYQTPRRLMQLQRTFRTSSELDKVVVDIAEKIIESEKQKKEIRKAIKYTESCLKKEKYDLQRAINNKKFFEREQRLFKKRCYSHRKWAKEHPLIVFTKMIQSIEEAEGQNDYKVQE